MTKQYSSRMPSLKINAISNWATLGVNIVVGLLLTPFIISHLGKTGYGIWTLIGSFIGYYGLLNLGVGSAITRYVARYAGQGDEKALNETASTAMSMFCCTSALVIAVSFFLAGPLARFFNVETEHLNDFRHVVWIMGVAIGLGFPGSVYEAIVKSHEKFVLANSFRIVATLVRTGLVICLLLSGVGLVGVAFATLVTQIFLLSANFLLCRYSTPWVRVRFAFAKLRVLRMLIVYGGIATVITVADIIRINLDSFVIGKWVDLSAVGVYGIAALILRYIARLVTIGMEVLKPRFAALDGAKEHEKARRLLLNALSVSSFLSFGGCMMAIIFGWHFIVLWVGSDFTDAAVILWILSVCGAVALAQNPAIGFMYALNKHRFYAIATIIEAIANITLSILLVSRYGIIGVALGTMIPMLIVKILVMPVYASKIAGLSILEYLSPLVLPALVALVMINLAYYMGIITQDTPTIGYLISAGIITGVLYVAACYVVVRKYNPAFILSVIPGSKPSAVSNK